MPNRHAAWYGTVILLLWRAAPCAKPEGLCGATRTQATCSSAGLTRPSTPPTSTTPQAGAPRGAAPAPPSAAARARPRAMRRRARRCMTPGCYAPPSRARAHARRYFGSAAEAEKRLPFDAGFEAVGVVAAVGPGVEGATLTGYHTIPYPYSPLPEKAACTARAGALRTPLQRQSLSRRSRASRLGAARRPRGGRRCGADGVRRVQRVGRRARAPRAARAQRGAGGGRAANLWAHRVHRCAAAAAHAI